MAKETTRTDKQKPKRQSEISLKTEPSLLTSVGKAIQELSKRILEIRDMSKRAGELEKEVQIQHNIAIEFKQLADLRNLQDMWLHQISPAAPEFYLHRDESSYRALMASHLATRQVVELIPYLRASIASEQSSLKENELRKIATLVEEPATRTEGIDDDSILYEVMGALVDNMNENVAQMRKDIKALNQFAGK